MENFVAKLYDTQGTIYGEVKYNLESFKHFSKHSHATFSLSAVDTHDITVWYHGEGDKILHPDQIAVYNPQHVHMTASEHPKPIPYYNLHLDTQWCLAIQQEVFPQIQHFLPLETLILGEPSLREGLGLLLKLIRTEEPHTIELLLRALLKDIFILHCASTGEETPENRLLHQVEAYILSHLQEPVSIEDIASEVGYSTAHINRVFKQHYGLTPHAFMIDQRIHKAKEYLLKSDHPNLSEVALEAGFYDQSHFIKAFKKAYSISPNHYTK